jgi:hypothetical protein
MPCAKTKPDTAAIIIAKLLIIRKLLLSAPSAPVSRRGSHSYPVDIIAAFEEPGFFSGGQWSLYGTLPDTKLWSKDSEYFCHSERSAAE